MEPKINQDLDFARLPAEYDDDRGILTTIHRVIEDDLKVGISRKRCQAKTRAWELLSPSFEQADVLTLEDLGSPEGIGRLTSEVLRESGGS